MAYRFLQISSILVFSLYLTVGHASAAPSVSVFGSGSYSDTNVTVSLFATTTDCSLMSFGVLLNFNPADVTADNVTRNETVWYMGDGVSNSSYIDPAIDAGGSIKIIGARMDIASPMAGVSGTKESERGQIFV